LFSPEGRPLRASMSFGLSQQKITAFQGTGQKQPPLPRNASTGGSSAPAGTEPLTQAPAGLSLQNLVDSLGNGADWPSVAAANGVENPRLLAPGQLLNLNARSLPGGLG
jgi:hypothetical protein